MSIFAKNHRTLFCGILTVLLLQGPAFADLERRGPPPPHDTGSADQVPFFYAGEDGDATHDPSRDVFWERDKRWNALSFAEKKDRSMAEIARMKSDLAKAEQCIQSARDNAALHGCRPYCRNRDD